MDYEEALKLVTSTRDGTKKNINKNLQLRTEIPAGETIVRMRYFSTDVLTWFPDGRVRINFGDWWGSQCTHRKIDEYLPRGWRILVQNLEFMKNKQVGILQTREPNWEILTEVPFMSDSVYTKHGGIAHSSDAFANSLMAGRTLERIEKFTRETVEAFVDGKIPYVTPAGESRTFYDLARARSEFWRDSDARSRAFYELLYKGEVSSSFVQLLLEPRPEWNSEASLYWSEDYPNTGPAKTLKAKVEQMEYRMRGGHKLDRFPRSSQEFRNFKKNLLLYVEKYCLEAAGFELFDRRTRESR